MSTTAWQRGKEVRNWGREEEGVDLFIHFCIWNGFNLPAIAAQGCLNWEHHLPSPHILSHASSIWGKMHSLAIPPQLLYTVNAILIGPHSHDSHPWAPVRQSPLSMYLNIFVKQCIWAKLSGRTMDQEGTSFQSATWLVLPHKLTALFYVVIQVVLL